MSPWRGRFQFCRNCWALLHVVNAEDVYAKRRWFGLWRYFVKCGHCKAEVTVFPLDLPPRVRRGARGEL